MNTEHQTSNIEHRMQRHSLLACSMFLLFFALSAPADQATPTFTKDVAPLIFQNCVVCHRAGQIAPFSLTTYQEVSRKAKQIAEVTHGRIMPPWKPQPGHGEFADERRLTDAQIALLQRWLEAGKPLGDATAMPPLPTFREGWQLGEPDIVLKLPAPVTVPAEGADRYIHFVFPLELEKEIYVRGVEVRPGNLRVAHHAIGLLDATGAARKLDAKTPEPGYEQFGGPGFIVSGFTPGYVPGQTPRFFKEGSAIPIRKGTDFVLQMHYHPIGKVESDQTVVGLYLSKTPPTRKILGILLGSEAIDIPAGADKFTATDSFTLPVALTPDSIWAHMHMIGKEARVWAELPDGSKTKLLWINDWDFNWQDTYGYKTPVVLPKGTVVRAEWRFDNTANNPRNPNAPPKRVRLGENSTDEMAGIWLGGEVVSDFDLWALLAANVGHYFEVTAKGKKFREQAGSAPESAAR